MAKDLDKRRRIMQRSIKLGHCICDPQKPCPCDLLKLKDVCLCAGEQLPVQEGPVRLTRLVEKAGCASKIDKASLKRILKDLPTFDDPRVVIGMPAGDDAGVYRLDDTWGLVQTVDVFSPSVDDPYLFGQVAAANSVSDVYAMGGRPVTALSIIGFPLREVPDEVMRDILRGGIDKMAEAEVAVIGGHSIKDRELKAGFAVTGLVELSKVYANAGARPGDALVLTKPLGTGVLSFADQIDRAQARWIEAAGRSMAALNRTAAELMVHFGAHACTDVTGFGLAGHLGEMAAAAGVDVQIVWDDLPVFDGLLESLAAGIVPGGIERNRESSAEVVDLADGATEPMADVLYDPQTSGGLLIALPAARADEFVQALREQGVEAAAVVGRVLGEGPGRVRLTTTGRRSMPEPNEPLDISTDQHVEEVSMTGDKQDKSGGCCGGSGDVSATGAEPKTAEPDAAVCCSAEAGPAGDVQGAFMGFLNAANSPNELDVTTKKLIAIALSVLSKCEPCVKAHVTKALKMGITRKEIDDAAWLAISFGGSPTMMFYNGVMKEL